MTQEPETANPTPESGPPSGGLLATVKANWPGPALVLSTALLVGAMLLARQTAKGHDFAGALENVQRLIENGHPNEALDALNDKILPYLDDPQATLTDKGEFYALRGDALFEIQQLIGAPAVSAVNSMTILSDYEEAERAMHDLTAAQHARVVGALLSLGRFDEAVNRINAIPDDGSGRRERLLRQALQQQLDSNTGNKDNALQLLSELAEGRGASERDRLWAIARQTELRLESGHAEEALSSLLRVVSRLGQEASPEKAELYTLLAWSYYDLGRMDQALKHLDIAESMSSPTDNLVAEIRALRGRINQIDGDPDTAHDYYAETVDAFPELPATVACKLGLAELDAGDGRDDEALAEYDAVIRRMPLNERRWRITTESVAQSLATWRQARYVEGDFAASIEYAKLGELLYGPERLTADIPLALAQGHDALGREILEEAGVKPDSLIDLADVEPVTRAEARQQFMEAAEQFIRHARMVILADPEAFADSLWNAGVAYDLAGESNKAIEVFSEYANGDPDEPRHPAAVFRLAEAHQARGDYELARNFYDELIERNPNSPEGQRSFIRQAQTLLRLGDEASVERAESLLKTVVGSGMFSPEADEHRQGLFELGSMYYKQGRYREAIERLQEAIDRYPDDEQAPMIRYKLADSLRLSAGEIEQTLTSAMPDQEREELERLRTERLAQAQDLFLQVRDNIEALDPLSLDELDRRLLRNAMYFRADCAFDLGRYDDAIRWYDAAAQKYADDPSSLVAMMQIVNAYSAQGKWREAQTAQERVRQRLSEIPDAMFDDPNLPIDQRHWERWIANSPRVDVPTEGDGN
ncbi:MAG: tetratricopeptide repeat protein [Phycisphaeraceae bacterium]|nr:tetratricopeptide repeat protein [Phycisphaeraceae bacterium]